MRTLRGLFASTAALAVIAVPACGQPTDVPPGGTIGTERWATDFAARTVPLEEIVSGGPPKDGIPAIDRPAFVSVAEANRWISDTEPVALLRSAGETKVYPLQILIWHEIVNDRLGDTPLTVTFCPLCNTTLAFDRRLEGRILDFGTTGRLRHSDLIMYDRQTETWWQQATGEAIVGELSGETLTFIPAPVVSWREVRESHADALVLSRETGYTRPYGRNPYTGYDRQRSPIAAFFRREGDPRLPAMERVLGLWNGERAVAISFSALAQSRVFQLEWEDRPVVILWAPGTSSALDSDRIDTGRDIGSAAAYEAVSGGQLLSFEAMGTNRFRDRETGTVWSAAGEAVEGRLEGSVLPPVVHGNHFWFAWQAFQPDTELLRQPPSDQ